MRSDGPALLPVFRSQHQAELLMWLMLHPDQEFGVSDLAARLGVPLSTLHREVVRLDEAGLIASHALGRNRMLRAWGSLPEHSPEADRWIDKAGPEHYAEHLPRLREWVRQLGP